MQAYYAFFSPLHKELGLLPLTDFAWLTPDRRVQRTVFGKQVELIANFRSEPFVYRGHPLPGRSFLAVHRAGGQARVFTPRYQ